MYKAALALVATLASGVAPLALARSDDMNGIARYVVPPEGPYSVFRIHDYKVKMVQSDGRHILSFALPADLTGGQRVVLEFKTVNETDDDQPIDFFGINNSQGATAHCTPGLNGGDWDNLNCNYDMRMMQRPMRNQINQQNVNSYLDLKYGNSGSATQRKTIAQNFLAEPIGKLGTQGEDNNCFDCKLSDGEWRVSYANPQGQQVNAQMTIDRDHGSYYLQGGRGDITQLSQDGDGQATAFWRFSNGATGWLRFRYSNDDRSFQGEWGTGGTPGQQRVGYWNGQRIF